MKEIYWPGCQILINCCRCYILAELQPVRQQSTSVLCSYVLICYCMQAKPMMTFQIKEVLSTCFWKCFFCSPLHVFLLLIVLSYMTHIFGFSFLFSLMILDYVHVYAITFSKDVLFNVLFFVNLSY